MYCLNISKCVSVVLSIFTLLYNQSPKLFHLARLEFLFPLQLLSIPLPAPVAYSTFCLYQFCRLFLKYLM